MRHSVKFLKCQMTAQKGIQICRDKRENCVTLVQGGRWPGVWINGSLQQNSSPILMIATTCHRSHFSLDHRRHHCWLRGLNELHKYTKTVPEGKYLLKDFPSTKTNNMAFLYAHCSLPVIGANC